MKKRVIVSCVISVLLFSMFFSSCKTNTDVSTTEFNSAEKSVTQIETTLFPYEETTERIPDPVLPGNLSIRDGAFNIIKTDFESRYNEEFLTEISSLISLPFGYEDYYNWNGNAQDVVNELINACISTSKFPFRAIYCDDEIILEKASQEAGRILNDDSIRLGPVIKLDALNSYIKDMFGENARTFVGEDFLTAEEALLSDESILNYHNEGYSKIMYLPETDVLYMSSRETGFSCYNSFIYDIKEIDGDYLVYSLGDIEDYGFGNNFSTRQAYMFEYLSWGGDNYIPDFVYTVGVSENGDLYLKKVDTKCIFSNDFHGDYIVTADTALYECRIFTQPHTQVGIVEKGTVVTIGINFLKRDYEYIVNEDISGFIDPAYLQEIE